MKLLTNYLRVVYPLLLIVGFLTPMSMAGDVGPAPAKVQAAVFLKCLAFNKNITSGGDITLYVIGSADFAGAIKPAEGKAIGSSKLAKVVESADVPADKPAGPAVIYVGDAGKFDAVTAYSQSHKILSMTGLPDLAVKGITLTVGVQDGKPKILLNLTSTKAEGINWNPAILKVASSIK